MLLAPGAAFSKDKAPQYRPHATCMDACAMYTSCVLMSRMKSRSHANPRLVNSLYPIVIRQPSLVELLPESCDPIELFPPVCWLPKLLVVLDSAIQKQRKCFPMTGWQCGDEGNAASPTGAVPSDGEPPQPIVATGGIKTCLHSSRLSLQTGHVPRNHWLPPRPIIDPNSSRAGKWE